MLLRRFRKCSIPVKCYLFKTYCSNVYCAQLWYNFTLTTIKKDKKLLTIAASGGYISCQNITASAS